MDYIPQSTAKKTNRQTLLHRDSLSQTAVTCLPPPSNRCPQRRGSRPSCVLRPSEMQDKASCRSRSSAASASRPSTRPSWPRGTRSHRHLQVPPRHRPHATLRQQGHQLRQDAAVQGMFLSLRESSLDRFLLYLLFSL
jgi:hypothetical protein